MCSKTGGPDPALSRHRASQFTRSRSRLTQRTQAWGLGVLQHLRHTFSHVGIYVGDNKFIHSPRAAALSAREDIREAYWQKRFDGARVVRQASMPVKSMGAK